MPKRRTTGSISKFTKLQKQHRLSQCNNNVIRQSEGRQLIYLPPRIPSTLKPKSYQLRAAGAGVDLLETKQVALVEMCPGSGKTFIVGMMNATLLNTFGEDTTSLTIILPASAHLAHEQQFELGVNMLGFTMSHNNIALLEAEYKNLNHVTVTVCSQTLCKLFRRDTDQSTKCRLLELIQSLRITRINLIIDEIWEYTGSKNSKLPLLVNQFFAEASAQSVQVKLIGMAANVRGLKTIKHRSLDNNLKLMYGNENIDQFVIRMQHADLIEHKSTNWQGDNEHPEIVKSMALKMDDSEMFDVLEDMLLGKLIMSCHEARTDIVDMGQTLDSRRRVQWEPSLDAKTATNLLKDYMEHHEVVQFLANKFDTTSEDRNLSIGSYERMDMKEVVRVEDNKVSLVKDVKRTPNVLLCLRSKDSCKYLFDDFVKKIQPQLDAQNMIHRARYHNLLESNNYAKRKEAIWHMILESRRSNELPSTQDVTHVGVVESSQITGQCMYAKNFHVTYAVGEWTTDQLLQFAQRCYRPCSPEKGDTFTPKPVCVNVQCKLFHIIRRLCGRPTDSQRSKMLKEMSPEHSEFAYDILKMFDERSSIYHNYFKLFYYDESNTLRPLQFNGNNLQLSYFTLVQQLRQNHPEWNLFAKEYLNMIKTFNETNEPENEH